MANFQPYGKILIGRVPFDNSYRHTLTFDSVTSQTQWMMGRMESSLEKDTYTYVRMNNSIKVMFNAERLYTYDYVMYQNSNYGDKWFYAFIVGVNYVNENCTELVLELDVMQTWYFDYTLKRCMVEREHVNDDSIGAHLNPEPEFPFNLVAQNKYSDDSFDETYAVVQTNSTPHYGADLPWEPEDVPNGNEPVAGGVYSRVVNGAAYYAFYAYDFELGEEAPFQSFLRDMNKSGSADSISNVFQFPAHFLAGAHPSGDGQQGTAKDSWKGYRVDVNANFLGDLKTYSLPSSLDGHVPRNNKLFTYPYCFVRVEDNAGHHTEWKYELWNEHNGNREYRVMVPLDPDATAFVVPQNYDGEDGNYEASLTFPCTAKSSWNYSAYQMWSAQNHLANTFNGLMGVAATAVPAAKGISAASSALGVGLRSASRIAARGGTPAKTANILSASAQHGYGQLDWQDKASFLSGVGMLGTLAGTVSRQSKIPDTVKGSASGNSLFGVGAMTYNIKNMCLQNEFAEILDDFFDMYGYQIDRIKIPNREGRPYWNYVKCQNSCHVGNVPSDMMSQINHIYDSGITFWHTDDVGNYSLNNH